MPQPQPLAILLLLRPILRFLPVCVHVSKHFTVNHFFASIANKIYLQTFATRCNPGHISPHPQPWPGLTLRVTLTYRYNSYCLNERKHHLHDGFVGDTVVSLSAKEQVKGSYFH